ncbi:MAG: carbamoyltransferase HypF [Polyangia bacterium]
MPDPDASVAGELRVCVAIRGAVQGVGFRPFVYRLAHDMGIRGWVSNSAAGVTIEAESDEPTLRRFLARLESEKPAIAIVQTLEAVFLDPAGFHTFEIRPSTTGTNRTLVMPDLTTCSDCIADIFQPTNRRFRYPFTNCTNCGPRFSIISALPYDRHATTMARFTMCAACAQEYSDPANRRFHAQPNACPACGPRLALWDRKGATLAQADAALVAAAQAIRAGSIVAVKGLGGFHLVVDARSEPAVRELRRRKHREEKPFAVLVPSLADALRLCHASAVEQQLLRSPASPIVLLRRRKADEVALAVAPGNPTLGVMLPSTPLHHLLLSELGFSVIATSGNLSDEPICTDEREALARLGDIADLFLVHDRPILHHVDDSIVRELAGRELVLRRARGLAPLPIAIKDEVPTTLALGAQQKSAIGAAIGSDVFISQHIGDLENQASLQAFTAVIAAFSELYQLRPQTVACDLHPDYLSTQYAEQMGIPVVRVQHHLAHAFACMADNQLEPPVLAVTWDGSGFAGDGTVWGGDMLHITPRGYRRVACLRPFPLLGNAKAVREPRRAALALLFEIFADAAFTLDQPAVRAFSAPELAVLAQVLRRRTNSPLTTSAGRLFDAVASLLDLRHLATFEGQAAMELEFALPAHPEDNSYPYAISTDDDHLVLDWEPMVRALIAEAPDNLAHAAARFHNTLVEMATEVAGRVQERNVVLSGGCLQNRYLCERLVSRLRAAGFSPYWHQRVPPNDGGIALGQVLAVRYLSSLRKE